MRALNLTTLLLIIIGGVNWLLVGIADLDLVATCSAGRIAFSPPWSMSWSACPPCGS